MNKADPFKNWDKRKNEGRERWLFAYLLVAIMVGTIGLKIWVISVEERLADNLEMHWDSVGAEHSQTNILETHERRLRSLEHSSWSILDGWLRCGENKD